MMLRLLAFVSIGLSLCAVARADQEASCEMNISGGRTATVKGKAMKLPPNPDYKQVQEAKKVSAGTDYWLTEANVREQLRVLASTFLGSKKKTPEQITQEVDTKMKRDPRLMLLEMSCGDKDWSLVMSPSRASKYSDVPFKPGHYVISKDADDSKPAQFPVTLTFGEGANGEVYRPSENGTIDIEQFDNKMLTGKFSFKARQRYTGDKQLTVNGTFRYSCIGDKCGK